MNIGILASGGDGAGMNYCLYKLYKNLYKTNNIFLYNKGFLGLINDDILPFDQKYLKKYSKLGGIVIKTSRCPEFITKKGQEKALKNLKKRNIDVVIVMGGNGSYNGAVDLLKMGVNVMFIPCTIDNDVLGSENSIGFSTACIRNKEYIDIVSDTMKSFDRTCIFEVMGRKDGYILKSVAKLVNADIVYDENFTFEQTKQKLEECLKTNPCPIILVQENLIDIKELENYLKSTTTEIKSCVVGYFQRGGAPTKEEIEIAKNFADCCSKNISKNQLNKKILVKNRQFVAESIKLI